MPQQDALEEMNEALEASNSCSTRLEALLEEARATKTLDPQLMDKIKTADVECDLLMQRYLKAYKACNTLFE